MQTVTITETIHFLWKEDFESDPSNYFDIDTPEDEDLGPRGIIYAYTKDKIYDSDGYYPPKILMEDSYRYVESTFLKYKETLKHWDVSDSIEYDEINFEEGIYILPKKLKKVVENKTMSKATIKRNKWSMIGMPMEMKKCKNCGTLWEYQRQVCKCRD